jgi:tetratricopeptide (TPR) repeat protein
MAERALADGHRLLREGDAPGAARKAKRALLAEPGNPRALLLLFEASMASGQLDDARMAGHQLLELEPEDLKSRLTLAQLELAANAADRALDVLADVPSGDRAAAALIACAHEQQNRPHLAGHYRDYALSATHINEESVWGEYFREQCCELLDRLSDNESLRLASLLRDPDESVATEVMGSWVRKHGNSGVGVLVRTDLDLMKGKIPAAIKRLDSFAFEAEWRGAVENRRGDIALLAGDLEAARTAFRKATVLDPSDENAWMDLIRTEMLLGQPNKAIETIEKARSTVTSDEVRDVINGLIEELSNPVANRGGSIVGLAWTETGGALLEIEISIVDDTKELRITGEVDRDMEQSAQVAFQCLKDRWGLFDSSGAHIHFPTWRVRKHGASAGLAIAAALFAAATNKVPSERFGLTGELTLSGNVYPIGGLREKVTAAMLSGISLVVYPLANRPELTSIPASVRRRMRLIPTTDIGDLETLVR